MVIRVLFFASLKEAVGLDLWECRVPEGAAGMRLDALLAALRQQLGAAGHSALTAENVRIAVNQEFIDDKAVELRAGDEVAFLPPVTGG